jgi:hypothetical protein
MTKKKGEKVARGPRIVDFVLEPLTADDEAEFQRALAEALGLAGPSARPSFAETVRRCETSGSSARLWAIANTDPHAPDDGVVVSTPAAHIRAQLRRRGAQERSLLVVAFDATRGAEAAVLGVEDAKRLVNALGQAIAAVEAMEVAP